MRILKAACVLLLLFACACNGVNVFVISDEIELQNLPPGVAESIRQHWPGAQLRSAERIYTSDSWGDYRLNFELPGGMIEAATLSKSGAVKWRSQPLSPR